MPTPYKKHTSSVLLGLSTFFQGTSYCSHFSNVFHSSQAYLDKQWTLRLLLDSHHRPGTPPPPGALSSYKKETKFLINTTCERRLIQGHETPLKVKGDIEDVSSELDNRA
ncbi:hypothetical protein TNCV_3392181 [Trichonephila clavipes]|nr:hypothetical protein TNCV_3392181 [Trichonephila clavipes]